MSPTKPRVLVYGAGAIGITYAFILEQAGCEVAAVCRSNYEVAKAYGFTVSSPLLGYDHKAHPKVYRDISEATSDAEPYDYILITTKAFPNLPPAFPSPVAAAIAPAISPTTTIVLIQNGIDIEQEYATLYPSNTLLSCAVYLPATQVSPGVVETGSVCHLQIGSYPSTPKPSEQALTFGELISQGGGTAKAYADIQPRRWRKLLLNCSWNPLCALSRSSDVDFLNSGLEAEGYVRDVMGEVAAVAKALGYDDVEGEVEGQVGRAVERARKGEIGIEPSMLADVKMGRRLEVEAILGNVVRRARGLGVQVPRLERLYVLCKALDIRIGEGRGDGGSEYGIRELRWRYSA